MFLFCFTLIFGIIFWCWKGVKVGLFTPGEAFEVVAKKRIMKLKEPATKMAVLVAEELRIILFNGLAKVSFMRVTRAVRRPLLLLIYVHFVWFFLTRVEDWSKYIVKVFVKTSFFTIIHSVFRGESSRLVLLAFIVKPLILQMI